MNTLFVDTQYWLALLNPGDRHHERARELRQSLKTRPFLTTNAILSEVLASCSDGTHVMRAAGVGLARAVLADPGTETVELTHELLLEAVEFYGRTRSTVWLTASPWS